MTQTPNNPSALKSSLELSSMLAGVATVPLAIAHEVGASAVENIPGVEHLSSIDGGFATGVALSAASESIANRLANGGHNTAAERTRRAGQIITLVGSAAVQVMVETSSMGVGDKWDIAAGVAGSIPGLFVGRAIGRAFSSRPKNSSKPAN